MLAVVLQSTLIAERLLFVVLCLLMGVQQTPSKRLAICNTVATAVNMATGVAVMPLRLALRVVAVLWANAALTLIVMLLLAVLAVLAEMSGGWLALLLNLYNTGVGVTLQNEWLQPLAWGEIVLGGLLPIWNLIVWLPRVLLRYVFVPSVSLKPEFLREMGGDSMLMTSSLMLSASSTAVRLLQCAAWDASSGAGLACIADHAYMHVDLMTPGIYARQLMRTVERILVAGCSGGNLVFALLLYPLLDFNLYKALHCLVNAVVHTVVATPIATVQRCRWAQAQDFEKSERLVMCMPDFSMSCSVLVGLVRALAQLLQNWADAALIVIERSLGMKSVLCETDTTAAAVNTMWEDAGGFLGRPQTVVPLTATLLAVTDGVSTVYSSLATADKWHAVANWPFAVDVRAGVAPVRHSRELDGDDAASVRTGMLGCTCVDVLLGDVPAVRIECATVPFRSAELQNASGHTVPTRFYPPRAELLLSCATLRLRVVPLLFSRKRVLETDEGWQDLDALGLGGSREPHIHAADAMVYVQPDCVGSGVGSGACVGEVSCFPFCMGLHVAGQNGEAITLYNAREWQESVSVAQMDCASMASVSAGGCAARVQSVSMALGFDDSVCPAETDCVASDAVVTRVPRRNQSLPVVSQRLQDQPFVVAGDVMLFDRTDSAGPRFVEVVRLFNNNRGVFVMQSEHLSLDTTRGADIQECDTTTDATCYVNAVRAGKVVLPPASASVTAGRSFPATVSEWGVHWTHNPDNLLLAGFFDACHGAVATTWDFGDQRPRVWTLRSARTPSVAYMLVPDWVSRHTECDQMANVQVLELNLLNAQNVLVQVLRTTPANYDWRAGTVRDPGLAETVFLYMNPVAHGCTDDESAETIYTCWRSAAEGLFPDETAQSFVLGSICPAARRTPSLGLALGETVVAGVETVRLLLDGVFVLGAVLPVDGNLDRVFALRLDKPAFHSVLDSSGAQLLSPDAVMDSIDRVAMYSVQTLLKIAALLSRSDAAARVGIARNLVLGTARLLQHTQGMQDLQGSALKQWQKLQQSPLAQTLGGLQNNIVGMASGPGGQQLSALFSGMTSTLRVTSKLLQRILLKLLRGSRRLFALNNAGGVIGSVIQDTFDDMKRGWFDPARSQCLGIADLFGGTTPVAVFFRDVCLSVPDGLQGMVDVLLVLMLDYTSMRCACVLGAAQAPLEVVRDMCLKRDLPAALRATLKRIAGAVPDAGPTDAVALCFASMDAANQRLTRAFDAFFSRLYSAAAGLGDSLDWVVAFWDEDAGDCHNFESPYVVTLIPEPSDYFMMCSDTATCRSKCRDEIGAFETARLLTPQPTFTTTQAVVVKSRYFSVSDVENDRHLAPFAVLALTELESCVEVCGDGRHPRDRCVVAAGLAERQLAVAYYCVPADIMRFVVQYAGLPFPVAPQYAGTPPDERIDNVYLLSTDGVQRGVRDTLLVLSRSASAQHDRLALVQAGGLTTTLLKTQQAAAVGLMQSVQLVRVVPQGGASLAHVLIRGQVFQWRERELHPTDTCWHLVVDAWSEQMPTVETHAFPCAGVFSSQHVDTCLAANCSRVLRMPLAYASERTLQTLRLDESHERVLSSTVTRPGAEAVAEALHMQKSRSVYRTRSHETAVNARHIAARTTQAEPGRVCLLMSGVVDRREAWLQNLCVDLTSGGVSVGPASDVEEQVRIAVECGLHSCAGCQSALRSSVFDDLQMKCFLASRCAVARCVGSAVNVRRPLCNMGGVAAGWAEEALLLSQGIWDALSSSIVVAVEITAARRETYVVQWPEQMFLSQVCHAKDMVLKTTAVVTSIVGGVDALAEQRAYDGSGELSAVLDARYHARRIMTSTAVTSLVGSLLMAPLFAALALRKTMSCTINDVFLIVETLLSPAAAVGEALGISAPRVVLGTRRFMSETSAVVGSCVTEVVHGLLRNVDTDEGLNGLGSFLAELLGDITRMTALRPLEPIVHMFDATVSYMIGVVTATESLLATVDWRHCRPPVAAMADTSRCVCGDTAHGIPDDRKRQQARDNAFWCSGPLLMTTAVGREVLVWNPFSLQELLEPAAQFETFLSCFQGSSTDCSRPTSPNMLLEAQGVELMQVVTQCRGNYQARRWDAGAVLMGVLSHEEWDELATLSPSALQAMWATTDDAYHGVRRRWARISEYMGSFRPSDAILACLHTALVDQLWQHHCLEQALRSGWADKYEYFMYEPSSASGFVDIDACRSFSGRAAAFAPNGAAHSPMMWSSGSTNPLPVAEYHYVRMGTDRAQVAEDKLRRLHEDIMRVLQQPAPSIAEDVDVKAMSREGDELHQILDCYVMGPYAAADMHASFELGGGGRFAVPQYHRGSPASREFAAGAATGGSDTRRDFMDSFLGSVHEQVNDQVRALATATLNHWRYVMADINNLRCVCADSSRSMACCQFATRADITYPARGLQLDTDIGDSVLEALFDADETQAQLQGLWTKFRSPDRRLSDAERVQLRDVYVFDFRQRVLEYSVDETPLALGGTTLWEQCTALLSASFFTLPLREDLAADLAYDPTHYAGPGYLHGMEAVIERVLSRARAHSPVFWTHVHRYVASDSVWCEDTTAPPQPHAPAPRADQHDPQENPGGDDRILAPALDAVQFPADARCICNWTASDACRVPTCDLKTQPESGWPLQAAWLSLCTNSTYTTRDELFLFLEVMQQFQLDTQEECLDVVPSVVWGLLDTRQQHRWFAGTSATLGLDLQELASHGAAGMRLGLLGGDDTLLDFLNEHKLLQSVRSYFNPRYSHTVAQPVCRQNLVRALHTDLSQHFADVFFPVAHSVHEAPVAATCSRWAVEFAVTQAMRDLRGNGSAIDQATIDRQQDTAAAWRRRCHVQLQQVGICALRGVLELKPADWDDTAANCSFTVATGACPQLFYVTSGCLLMCDGVVYDPCLCASDICDGYEFTEGCPNGIVTDVRAWAADDAVQLYSLHWPEEIRLDEAAEQTERWATLNVELQTVRTARAAALVDDAALFEQVRTLVLQHADTVAEGETPNAFCDDMADYMPAEAQHPVGYHPTCACTREETNMRGFSSWMSTPDATLAWAVDPVRWRNMSTYSTVFGAAHLVCDAVAYSMAERALNAFYLTSVWDPGELADPAMPVRSTDDETTLNRMFREGSNPGQSERDHPCVPPADALVHSVGLVRDWFACYGHQHECPTTAEWPHNPSPAAYTLPPGAPAACAHPSLDKCRRDVDCQTLRPDLVCQKPWDEAAADWEEMGVCAHRDTCYQHAHCRDGNMCAGTGQCVPPRLYVRNELQTQVDVQLFSLNHTHCGLDPQGLSAHHIVDDFAQAHGLCQFRNWFHFQDLLRNSSEGTHELLRRVPLQQVQHRTDDADAFTLEERGVLKQEPHACDRSYQHTAMHICQPDSVDAWLTFASTAAAAPVDVAHSIRTWRDGAVSFCNLHGRAQTGFLNPYDQPEDSLHDVPNDIRLCREFELCPEIKFLVQGRAVAHRKTVTATGMQRHGFADLQTCGPAGRLQPDGRCAVDHLVVPVLDWVFSYPDGPVATALPLNPAYSAIQPLTEQWGPAAMQDKLTTLLVRCPHAFGGQVARYREYMQRLAFEYPASEATEVAAYANRLLLQLFGIDMSGDGVPGDTTEDRRGFNTLAGYREQAACAEYVLERLDAVQEHNRALQAYTVEQLWDPPVPGTSLYLFRGMAVIYTPFAWFWRCAVATRSVDGGAETHWLRKLEDTLADVSAADLVCRMFTDPLNPEDQPATESVQEKLQRKSALFDFEPKLGGRLLTDIDAVLQSGLDALKISMFPDTYCVRSPGPSDPSCDPLSDTNIPNTMTTGACHYKTGRDIANDIQTPPSRVHNILVEARRAMLGDGFGNASDFFEANIDMLAEGDYPLQLNDDVAALVDATLEFIPRVTFVKARKWLTDYEDLLENDVLPDPYIRADVTCPDSFSSPRGSTTAPLDLVELAEPEFHVRADSDLLTHAGVINVRFLSMQRALYFLVRYFVLAIRTAGSFRAGSMLPSERSQAQMYDLLTEGAWKDHVEAALSYAEFMETKNFECSDDRAFRAQVESNALHSKLRACVRAMQEETGWRVSAASTDTATTNANVLQIAVPAAVLLEGFLPSFIESAQERSYLEELFQAEWADRADPQRAVCSLSTSGAQVHNPYWAGMFDRVTGCDVRALGEPSIGLRTVDGTCATLATDQACGERFPRFDAALHGQRGMPGECTEMYAAGQVFSPPPASSLGASETPLCQRRAARPEECTRHHGTLLNSRGSAVGDLRSAHNITVHAGVWAAHNPVTRETDARFVGTGRTVGGLRVLRSDIAGHALLFRITGDGQMRLQCLYMDRDERMCAQEAAPLLARSAEYRTWQDTLLQKQWPEETPDPSWRCPLSWLAAYSDVGDVARPFAARTPSPLRNRARFAHITGDRRTHPTVHSSRPMLFLTTGRFISETRVCTDQDPSLCRSSDHLQATLAELREWDQYYRVQYVETKQCLQLLDWPHQDYQMADNAIKTGNVSEQRPCNVYGRLPRFAIKRNRRAPATDELPPPAAAFSPAHACRMGRLSRLGRLPVDGQPPAQYCRSDGETLRCEAWANYTRAQTEQPIRAATAAPRRAQPVTRRRRRCRACEDHTQGGFVDRRGRSSVLNASRPQLSVGEPMALHPARMIAAFLRKAVCPQAHGACPALSEYLSADGAGAQAFLTRLLQPPPAVNQTSASDEQLWARPWGFCDQSAGPTASQGCAGTLAKSAWLNHSTRAQQCAVMVTSATSRQPAALELCLLDSTTDAMCRHMADWRRRVDAIACQAAGLAACPETGFFYTPTQYSVENAQFVHETVRSFYESLGECAATAGDAETAQSTQELINKETLAQCAALALAPVRKGLQQSRQIVSIVIEILFYALQIGIEFMNLLIAVVSLSLDALPVVFTRIVKWIGLLLMSIGQVWMQMVNTLFKILFSDGMPRELLDIIRALCEAISWLHTYLVQKGVCVILQFVIDAFNAIGDAFEKIPLVGKAAATPFHGWAQMLAAIDICGEHDFNCAALETPQTDTRASILTYPTRCWSTYTTFFGDTQSLSCSPADTCARTMGSTSDPVMCGACPLTDVQKFACAPETKLCTCSVASVTESRCLSNEECRAPGRNCRYLNSALEPAAGSIACSSCQTPTVCMLQPGESTGTCACPLRHMEFARCRPDQLGQDVFPAFGELCLFSGTPGTAMTYSVVVEDVMTRACDDLLAEGAVCSAAAGTGYLVLGHATHGRRLLADDDIHTLSPLCADALGNPGLPAVRAECERAHATSVRTLHELGLWGRVPPCALCSVEDALAALRAHPQLAMRVLLQPTHVAAVLRRHTPARHALAAWRTVQDSARVLARDMQELLAGPDLPPLLRRLMRALNTTTDAWQTLLRNASSDSAARPGRRLLGLASVKRAFEQMMDTGTAYKNQLNTGWDYVYPDMLSPDRQYNPWIDKVWPPFKKIASPDDSCVSLVLLLETLNSSTHATAQAYRRRPPLPSATLRWLRVRAHDLRPVSFPTDRDWLTRAALWVSRQLLRVLGVTPAGIYNLLVAAAHEVLDAVHCDFEAVQTCSRWNVRLINGGILMAAVQAAAVYACFACGLPLLGVASTALYVPAVLWTCYGYSPACVPLVPTCLVRDLVDSLQQLIPSYIVLPPSMLRPHCAMTETSLLVHDDCIVPCDEPPFLFDDAAAVVAWAAAELGVVRWADAALETVPWVDATALRAQLWLKHGVATHGGGGLVLGHRICAAVSSYKLLPYLLLAALLLVLLFAVAALLLDFALAIGVLVTSVTVTVFTE